MRSPTVQPDASASPASGLAALCVDGHAIDIEYAWVGSLDADAPHIVFLHEGLGSLAMWKDFPRALCAATGSLGLVFSRPGYGRSTPRAHDEKWPVDFMHRQAHEVLPALFAHLAITQPTWLFGHSDGASIALLFAAAFPERVAGVIAVAPHVYVEDVSIRSITAARTLHGTTDLRQRLARYHADPDSAFWGWNDIWLDPAFRDWNIVSRLSAIRCQVLAIQGEDDEFGTMAQIDTIAHHVPDTQLYKLPACGHSPHRDQPAALIEAVKVWMQVHPLHAGAGPFQTISRIPRR